MKVRKQQTTCDRCSVLTPHPIKGGVDPSDIVGGMDTMCPSCWLKEDSPQVSPWQAACRARWLARPAHSKISLLREWCDHQNLDLVDRLAENIADVEYLYLLTVVVDGVDALEHSDQVLKLLQLPRERAS